MSVAILILEVIQCCQKPRNNDLSPQSITETEASTQKVCQVSMYTSITKWNL